MRKLQIDHLTVESFATAPAPSDPSVFHADVKTYPGCPESYYGTCWATDWMSCACDTEIC